MLRPYQSVFKGEINDAYAAGAQVVLARMDTGGGKTEVICDLVAEEEGASAVIAHRQELVGQISMNLARHQIPHNVIAASATRRAIAAEHMSVLGRSFYDPGSRRCVASIDTLIRATDIQGWASQVAFWCTDEGHHVLRDNKWGAGIRLFTNPKVRGLLPTATPSRADGQGLGRHADGLADVMVQGPPMRWLIDQGYLCDYRMVIVESDLELLEADVGASGDWSTAKLREASKKSHIVGDVVEEYKKWGVGKLGVTFTSDTETAADICKAYQDAGVRAALLTGKTDGGLRRQILRQFSLRQIDQLVVVDIVSEGFDLPAIEVASLGRKTMSLATYMQQFGRALRPMYAPGFDLTTQAGRLMAIAAGPKPKAIIIDHVGNFFKHGPPDRPRPWTLERRDKGSRGMTLTIPLTNCLMPLCLRPFERIYKICPYCGTPVPPPAGRSSPGMVDGDMSELDAATLAALRGAVEDVDRHHDYYRAELRDANMPPIGIQANVKRHWERQEAQKALRLAMDLRAGRALARGLNDSQIQREFFHLFGVDVLSAMTLGPKEAATLQAKIEATP